MNKLKKIFYFIFGLLFIYLTINILFRKVSTIFNINSILFLPIGACIIALWYIIWKYLLKKFEKLNYKKQILLVLLAFLVIIIIEIIVINSFEMPFGWDFEYIIKQSLNYAKDHLKPIKSSNPYYFQHFPNNMLLYMFLIAVFKIGDFFRVSDVYLFAEQVNAIVIFLTILFTYLYIKKTKTLKHAFFSLIIFLFFIPIFLYIPIIYSDTLALLFVPLLLYISTFFIDNNKFKRIISYFLFAVFTFVGCQIKMTVIFITLGIFIEYFLNKKYDKLIVSVVSTIVIYICLSIAFNSYFIKGDRFYIKYDNYGKIPYTHWVMMGIDNPESDLKKNAYGGYSGEDYIFTESFNNELEAKAGNIKEIKSRIKNYGVLGYFNFLTKKAVNCWGDGTYYIPIKMHWNNKYNMKNNLKFITGKSDIHVMFYVMSGVQYAFLIILCIAFIKHFFFTRSDSLKLLLSISMLMTFLLLWENRSRYLLHYIPLFVIIIVYNINDLLKFKEKE